MIIADPRKKGRKVRYVVEYLTWFKGYNADSDKWLNSRLLRNAPKVLEVWHKKRKLPGSHFVWEITSPFIEFYRILPTSPTSPPKIVPWYINTCHLFQFLQHHSNPLPYYFTMPMQSRILTPPFSSSLEVVPFNPVPNFSILHESSFLIMMLKCHHIHTISEIHNFHSLNFDLANGIWCILKDLSCSIHKAVVPTLNPFEALPSQLNPTHLCKIEMVSPCILQIENFSQNMLLCTTTHMEICQLFTTAQTIGMETL